MTIDIIEIEFQICILQFMMILLKNIGGEVANQTMENTWDVPSTNSIIMIMKNWLMNVFAKKHCAIERWDQLKLQPQFRVLQQ